MTITFEPLQPPPGPAVVDVAVVQLGPVGERSPTTGLIVEGSRLLVGIRKRNAEVEGVDIDAQAHAFGPDTLPASDPRAYDLVTTEEFIASPAGMHRVNVTARGQDGNVRVVSRNFRVVPEGGGNGVPDPEAPPEVLEPRTVPRRGASGIPVTVLPQIEFSEPVRNVPGNVRLYESEGGGAETLVPARLLAVAPGSQAAIDVTDTAQAGQAVVSLVIQAVPGLRYGKKYRLELTDAIMDLDSTVSGSDKPLVPYTTDFETYTLAAATTQDSFPSPGVAVQDGWAYLVRNDMIRGTLKVFDVRGPGVPTERLTAQRSITNRPVDLAVKPERLVVGTSVPARSTPSNVHVFDISRPDDPVWVGAASVSNGVLDGDLRRLVMRGNYVYALAYRKGVQTVDIRKAEENFRNAGAPSTVTYWRMITDLSGDGQGFGMNAVVSTIPLPVDFQTYWYPHDLDVGDYVVNGRTEPVVFLGAEERRAGTCWLRAGSPLRAAIISDLQLRTAEGQDLCPIQVALGRAAGREVAVLGVALGQSSYAGLGHGLAIVDVSDPLNPVLVGFTRVGVPDISDVTLDGDQALVASLRSGTEVVNIESLDRPYVAGRIEGLSGRLAVAEGPVYYSTGGGYADAPEGGLHVADLDPQCDLLDLRDESLLLDVVRDPLDGTFCGGGDVLAFRVCQGSRVTLQIDGSVPVLSLDGEAPRTLSEVPLAPGLHVVTVPFGTIGDGVDTERTFTLQAQSLLDPERRAERQGTIKNKIVNRAVLPVGRTFVKGVDLYDGHVVRQASDVKIQGRHLGLEITRAYSSAGVHPDGTMGAGWSWNYDAVLTPMSCGLVNVATADGGSQVFKLEADATFTAQRGYHTRLSKNTSDGTYEFIDKSGVRHYFREPVDPLQPEGARRLDRIVEPHGDRIEVAYDLLGRVSSVREVLRGERAVRSLDVRYRRVYRHDRVASIESSLGHRVEYDYDDYGNLTSVKRSGQNVDGGPDAAPASESYEYTTENLVDRHQMKAAVGPNEDRTEYAYHGAGDTVAGEVNALLVAGRKDELAKRVTEFANEGPAPLPETKFAYDFTQAPSGTFTTAVTDSRNNPTTYELNGAGSPTRILEPMGKETVITWVPLDILKETETDAEGRITRYGYDNRGNLTSEKIEKDGATLAETTYEYDTEFNKLTYKKDAENRETRYRINATYGDLELVTDAVSNQTEYHYDQDGQLDWTKDPRGYTTRFREFTDFGQAREIQNPLDQITVREYDSRNRLVREEEEPSGRVTRTTYDGFDRPVLRVVESGQTGGDERTESEYFPGGQVRATVNPLGGRTQYQLDGMNRVVRTSIVVGEETLTTAVEYDGNGNKVSETDRRLVRRVHEYDDLNRLDETRIESGLAGEGPLGVVAVYGYDEVGNKLWEKDQAGRQTDYEYDGLYRVRFKRLPADMPAGFEPSGRLREEYVHDKVGNLRFARDANGNQTERQYDGLDRVTLVRDPEGRETRTVYADLEATASKVNKRSVTELPRGLVTEYEFDSLNRVTLERTRLEGEDGDPATNGVTYRTATAYLDAERALSITDARDTLTRIERDGLGREIVRIVDTAGLALRTETEYDGAGNRTKLLDPRLNETTWRYDVLGRLIGMTDARQAEAAYGYDGEGLKVFETDRRGVTTRHTYDNLGRSRKAFLENTPFSPVGWSRETQYVDALQSQRREIDANLTPTVFDLDGLDRVVKETDFYSNFIETTWDGVNRRIVRDKRGHATRYDYDQVNRMVRVTDPAPLQGQTVETSYQDAVNRVTETDRRDIVKVIQTDARGRIVRITRAGGTADEAVLERNAYDGLDNKVLATDAEGKKTQFVYDAANRLASQTDGFESGDDTTTAYRYDRSGNRTKVIDPRSTEAEPSAEYLYDELSRVAEEWDGERNHTVYGYDEEGNRTSRQEPRLMATTYAYDELGKLLRVTQPATPAGVPVTRYQYDAARNRTRQTDALDHAVEMQYDRLNRLKKTTQDPGGLALVTETLTFDPNGNPEVIRDPKGQTTTSTFDVLNRVKTVSHAFAIGDDDRPWRHTRSTAYSYDANGNVQGVEEQVASGTDPPSSDVTLVTTRGYDLQDRLQSEVQGLPDGGQRTVAYTHYRNGVRKSVTDPAGRITQYAYDGQNRLEDAVTDFGTPAARTTSYTYWPDDLLKTVTYPNDAVATQGYDRADRLTSLVNARVGTTISSYSYAYDANGNRLTQVEANNGPPETTAYTYDALDRLETVTYPIDTAFPAGRVVTYGYDLVGNRTRETERTTPEVTLSDKVGVFDNANRLTSLTDLTKPQGDPARVTSFTWDANGNQVTKTANEVTTSYQYDLRNKLVEVGRDTSVLGRFQYDAYGRRTKKIGADGLRQYVYDSTSLLGEYDAGGLEVAKYDYGSDRLISLSRTDEGRRYFSLDGLRSVVNLTDDAGATVASYHFDAWGNFRFPSELDDSKNRFAFTGYEWDPELGLFNAKARYFDPQIGRFISQDSFLGEIDNPPSLHRYFYANANPTRFIDPTGHFSWDQAKAGWKGFKAEAFERAADIGDSVGGFAKGVYGAGEGLVKGAVGLAVGAAQFQNDVTHGAVTYAVTGNPQELHETLSDAAATGRGVVQEIKTTARVAAEAYKNPSLALDAATELGIAKTGEVLGGATFETAMLVAPMPKGAPVGAVVKEARHGVNLVAPRAVQRSAVHAQEAAARAAAVRTAAGTAEATGTRLPVVAGGSQGADAALAEVASASAQTTAAERIAARVEAMKANMTPAERARTTFSPAEVTLPDGTVETWVAAAGKKGYVPPRIRGDATPVVRPGRVQDQALPHINDAERAVLREARRRGARIDAIGATRPMCHNCVEALKKAGQGGGVVE